jgi:hypothetical protein
MNDLVRASSLPLLHSCCYGREDGLCVWTVLESHLAAIAMECVRGGGWEALGNHQQQGRDVCLLFFLASM